MLALTQVSVYAFVWLGVLAGVSPALAAQTSTRSVSSPVPLMTAGFAMPHTLVDLQSLHLLRACQSAFERTMRLEVANATANVMANAPSDPSAAGNDQPSRDSMFRPIPPAAVTAGRACLSRIGDTRALDGLDLPLLLRLAIGVNDDTLVHQVVMRQLALAGPVVRERGHVLETAIDALLHNHWNTDAGIHRTMAHDTLAQRYAAVLDTMQPAGQVVASRLRVMTKLAEAQAPAVWNVDDDLASARARLRVAMSVPLSAVSPEDTADVRASRSSLGVAWLTYLKTPVHDNLARWIAVRDSMLHRPPGQTLNPLLNHPAPSLTADYWFNLPSGTTAPVVPAPGAVSLILFGDDLSPLNATQLRKLHTTYPALQIVFVTMTHGEFNGQSMRAEPAREATLIQHHLTDELQFPGIVGVLQTRYHTEPGLTEIPVASPVLDGFHLDPRKYAGHTFVVDAQGVLVKQSSGIDGRLIQRLLLH